MQEFIQIPWWHYLVLLPITFFVWCLIHELAHAIIAWRHPEAKSVRIIPWPHRYSGKFYFARTEFYLPASLSYSLKITAKTMGLFFYVAPWVADFIAIALLLAGWEDWNVYTKVVLAGGIVDLITASIGRTDNSDLSYAAMVHNNSKWSFRVALWLFILGSITVILLKGGIL